MKRMVELVYRAYTEMRSDITRGFITQEHIDWVTDHLMLKQLSMKELAELWETVDDFFKDIIAYRDENGEVTGWKPYNEDIAFAMDTESAWKEVINLEALRQHNTTKAE